MTVPARFVLRDLLIASAAAGLWALASQSGAEPSVTERALQVVAGLGIAAGAALLHEWGHLLGALACKSKVRFPKRTLTPLLFDFDVAANSRAQFLTMSAGGYVGSALGLLLLWLVQPPINLTGYVAWVIAGGGMLATLVIEAPVTVRVARGAAPPEALLTVADPEE
jgi:hypothetical protein